MKKLLYLPLLVVLGVVVQVEAHDAENMKPRIVRESELQSEATTVEALEDNEQIIKILVGADDTAGQFTVFSDVFTREDSLVPRHIHREHDEAFYVVSGRFEVINGNEDEEQTVGPGTMVFVPRGTVHSWKSLEANSKFVVVYTPGGWEHYYNETMKLTPEQRADEDFMEKFRAKYDSYMVEDQAEF